jgi:hypothetical protein
VIRSLIGTNGTGSGHHGQPCEPDDQGESKTALKVVTLVEGVEGEPKNKQQHRSYIRVDSSKVSAAGKHWYQAGITDALRVQRRICNPELLRPRVELKVAARPRSRTQTRSKGRLIHYAVNRVDNYSEITRGSRDAAYIRYSSPSTIILRKLSTPSLLRKRLAFGLLTFQTTRWQSSCISSILTTDRDQSRIPSGGKSRLPEP